jgi:hypothetical protein
MLGRVGDLPSPVGRCSYRARTSTASITRYRQDNDGQFMLGMVPGVPSSSFNLSGLLARFDHQLDPRLPIVSCAVASRIAKWKAPGSVGSTGPNLSGAQLGHSRSIPASDAVIRSKRRDIMALMLPMNRNGCSVLLSSAFGAQVKTTDPNSPPSITGSGPLTGQSPKNMRYHAKFRSILSVKRVSLANRLVLPIVKSTVDSVARTGFVLSGYKANVRGGTVARSKSPSRCISFISRDSSSFNSSRRLLSSSRPTSLSVQILHLPNTGQPWTWH